MRKIDKRMIIVLLVFVIILSKIVRYTVMKETLVDWSSGYSLLNGVINKTFKFGLTISQNGQQAQNAGQNAGFLFSLLNILDIKTYTGFEIYITIIWNLILLAIILKCKDYLSINELLFVFLSISIINIWDLCLAKEPFQMLFFVMMFYVIISTKTVKKKYMLCIMIYILSFLFYRTYYIVMPFFMTLFIFIYKLLFNKKENNKLIFYIKILTLSFFLFVLIVSFMKYVSPSYYGELIWVRLKNYSARTAIDPLIYSTNVFAFSLNLLIVLVRLLFPIELLRYGPKYFLFVLYQIMISSTLLKCIKNVNEISNNRKIAIAVFISFILASSLFEPDFGSWIRHESVVFPVYIIMKGLIKEKYNDEKN